MRPRHSPAGRANAPAIPAQPSARTDTRTRPPDWSTRLADRADARARAGRAASPPEQPTGRADARVSAGQTAAPSRRPGADRRRGARQRGSATLEAVILTPALLLFVALLVFAGRTALARQAVQHAAWEAAREASLARTAADARAAASTQATALLTRLGCHPAVSVDTSGFAIPVTQPAQVSVAVACTIDVGELALPGVPGTITFHATADSPLDRYRSRG